MKVSKLIQLRLIKHIALFHSNPWKRISNIPNGSFISMCFARAPTMESASGTCSSPNKPNLAEEMRKSYTIAYQQFHLSFLISSCSPYQFKSLSMNKMARIANISFFIFKLSKSLEHYHSTASSWLLSFSSLLNTASLRTWCSAGDLIPTSLHMSSFCLKTKKGHEGLTSVHTPSQSKFWEQTTPLRSVKIQNF